MERIKGSAAAMAEKSALGIFQRGENVFHFFPIRNRTG